MYDDLLPIIQKQIQNETSWDLWDLQVEVI